ncbi:MAG: TetR family transcriptional regulator [Polaromonas sp.]|uniref:TetR family transcriptional regulator n=1 Tax=Polaromonas sp. TaxID=1869339 RepID=UPI0027310534|nr:TetR family transcriptional regulator [Polaromonas sp.]MDP1741279.1 TetR family transcriptional regulator [Polaromonas sp.]MDP1956230.1 TetR family transcriptional regulator [Polaromonas sp.]MDP3750284.1 TetR family transcriptional regulator [Polaromonas sp.]
MARRTKEEALATRHRLLDAAEHQFQAKGVSRTSLQDIARRAGATRGAVYWHFRDKADLFNAMMERVTLPLEQSFQSVAQDEIADPLTRIRGLVRDALVRIASDPQTRRVFEVATHKVEYVDELQAVRIRHLGVRKQFLVFVERGLLAAAAHEAIALSVPADTAARGIHAILDGLIQNWMLDNTEFDLCKVGQGVLDIYLGGLGFKPEQK